MATAPHRQPARSSLPGRSDGKHLTYLDSGQLIDLDPASGHPHVLVSRAKLAPLPAMTPRRKIATIASATKWPAISGRPIRQHLLFDADGRLWIYDLANSTGIEIAFTGAGSGDDPKFSPDGKSISFIRDNSLTVVRLRESGTPAIVVAPSRQPPTSSTAKSIGFTTKSLKRAATISGRPDSTHLAFLQMNETEVPRYPIEDWIPTHATLDLEALPATRRSQSRSARRSSQRGGGKTLWIKLPIQAGSGLHSALRLGRSAHPVDRNHSPAITSIATSISPILKAASHAWSSRSSDDKFVDDNYDV